MLNLRRDRGTLCCALTKFGRDAQIVKASEELAELSVALHHWRDGKASDDAVIDELADVLIMVGQFCCWMGESKVAKALDAKMERLQSLIGPAA